MPRKSSDKQKHFHNPEKAPRAKEVDFRSLVETVSDWIWEVDARGIYTYCSPQIRNLLGYEPEEIVGKTPFDLMPPEEARRASQIFEHCAGQGLPITALVNLNRRKDGQLVYLETTGVPIFDEAGTLTGFRGVDRDISERQKFEAALSRAEQEKRLILDGLSEVIFYVDTDLKILWPNRAACSAAGLTRDEMIGRNCYSIWGRSNGPCPDCAMTRAFRTGTESRVEMPLSDGRTLLHYGHPVMDKDGRLIGGIEVSLDITEQKRAEEALRTSAERYRDFISHGTEEIWRIEFAPSVPVNLPETELVDRMLRDGFLAECNEAYAASLGQSDTKQLIGRRLIHHVHPAIPSTIDPVRVVVDRRFAPSSFEHESAAKGGKPVFSIRSYIPIIHDGRLLHIWCTSRDITELKRAEQALMDSERRYRALFESAGDAILLLRGDLLVDCNRKAFEMLGGTADEIIGQMHHMLSPPHQPGGEDSEKAAQERILAAMEGLTQRFDWQYRRFDGTPVDVEVTLNRVDLAGEYLLLAIAKDLTERKRLQEQLWQSQKIEAVGRLAGGVAHDFNNLLTVIRGYSEILLFSEGGIDPALMEQVQEIKKAADKAAALTRQLLAFSRRQVLAPRVLDLNHLVANLEGMLKRLIGEDIALITNLQPALGKVKADPGQIEQVIVNLAVNSRDAMPQGGKLTIATQNVVVGDASGEFPFPINAGPYVRLDVTDTGAGMDAHSLEHLFEPFYTTKEVGKGTGLGLATVYGIVKQSGGYVLADSAPGKGTRVEVYLPQTGEPEREAEPRPSGDEVAGGTETILVAEDEAGVRALIQSGLSAFGYRVILAHSGEEALQISSSHEGPIHLLLTDVVMPGISGTELAHRLARARPETRILYMSGYTNDAMLRRGVQTAGMEFLQKPFTIPGLARKLRELLGLPKAGGG